MDKRQAFEALHPADQAALSEMAALFGKPEAIAIRFDDGKRFDFGQFRDAQQYQDFKKRVAEIWRKSITTRQDLSFIGRTD